MGVAGVTGVFLHDPALPPLGPLGNPSPSRPGLRCPPAFVLSPPRRRTQQERRRNEPARRHPPCRRPRDPDPPQDRVTLPPPAVAGPAPLSSLACPDSQSLKPQVGVRPHRGLLPLVPPSPRVSCAALSERLWDNGGGALGTLEALGLSRTAACLDLVWGAWIRDAARDPGTQSGRETALQESPLSEPGTGGRPAGRGGLDNLSREVGCEGGFEGSTT